MTIILFHKPRCSACKKLEKFLAENNVLFEKMDASTAKGKTEMIMNNIFVRILPALWANGKTIQYENMFDQAGKLVKEKVLAALEVKR